MSKLSFGRCRIPLLLAERGWSYQDLSDRTGIARSTLHSYTKKTENMPLLNALIIADAFGIEHPRALYELYYGEE